MAEKLFILGLNNNHSLTQMYYIWLFFSTSFFSFSSKL